MKKLNVRIKDGIFIFPGGASFWGIGRLVLSKGGFPINEIQRFFSPIMLSTPVKLIAKDSLRNTHIVPLRSILN